jgi:metal-dependent amidase/aminoacylase/carboxypeptidase family protein
MAKEGMTRSQDRIDPVIAIAQIINAAQTIVSSSVDPFDRRW